MEKTNQFEIYKEIESMQPGDKHTISRGRWSDQYQTPPDTLLDTWCANSALQGRQYVVKTFGTFHEFKRLT